MKILLLFVVLLCAAAPAIADPCAGPAITAPSSASAGSEVDVSVSSPYGVAVVIRDDQGHVLYDSDVEGTTGDELIEVTITIPLGASEVTIQAADGLGGKSSHTIQVT